MVKKVVQFVKGKKRKLRVEEKRGKKTRPVLAFYMLTVSIPDRVLFRQGQEQKDSQG